MSKNEKEESDQKAQSEHFLKVMDLIIHKRFDEANTFYDEKIKFNDYALSSIPKYKIFQGKISLLEDLKRYDEVIEICDTAIKSIPYNNHFFVNKKEYAIKLKDEERPKRKDKVLDS